MRYLVFIVDGVSRYENSICSQRKNYPILFYVYLSFLQISNNFLLNAVIQIYCTLS